MKRKASRRDRDTARHRKSIDYTERLNKVMAEIAQLIVDSVERQNIRTHLDRMDARDNAIVQSMKAKADRIRAAMGIFHQARP